MSTATAMVKTRRTASRVADAELGERAHMLIWRAGRTHTAVAEAIGMDPTAFGKKLKGKNGWALQEVIDLAEELGTTVAFLFGEAENPRPENPDGGTEPPVGLEPTTCALQGGRLAEVIPLRRAA